MDSQQYRGALAGQAFAVGVGCGVWLSSATVTAGVEEEGGGDSDDGVGDGLDDDNVDDGCSKRDKELGFIIDKGVDGSVGEAITILGADDEGWEDTADDDCGTTDEDESKNEDEDEDPADEGTEGEITTNPSITSDPVFHDPAGRPLWACPCPCLSLHGAAATRKVDDDDVDIAARKATKREDGEKCIFFNRYSGSWCFTSFLPSVRPLWALFLFSWWIGSDIYRSEQADGWEWGWLKKYNSLLHTHWRSKKQTEEKDTEDKSINPSHRPAISYSLLLSLYYY